MEFFSILEGIEIENAVEEVIERLGNGLWATSDSSQKIKNFRIQKNFQELIYLPINFKNS